MAMCSIRRTVLAALSLIVLLGSLHFTRNYYNPIHAARDKQVRRRWKMTLRVHPAGSGLSGDRRGDTRRNVGLRDCSHQDGLAMDDQPCVALENLRSTHTRCVKESKVCTDQGRFILFADGRKDFEPMARFKEYAEKPSYHHPDSDVMGTPFRHREASFRPHSSVDPPDILHPVFSPDTLPVFWRPEWLENYGEIFSGSVMPIAEMVRLGAIDRNVTLAPDLDGFAMHPFMEFYLRAFTDKQVFTLDTLSSRERMGDPAGSPRCFETALFCRLESILDHKVNRDENNGLPDVHGKFHPASTGQAILKYYEQELDVPPKDANVFKIMFINRTRSRRIINLEEIVRQCSEWDHFATPSLKIVCVSRDFHHNDNLLDNMAELQTVDLLVGVHGAGLNNAFFMKPGSALVELLGGKPYGLMPRRREVFERYFNWGSRAENIVLYWQVMVAPYRSVQEWSLHHMNGVDQDVILDFEWLQDLFEQIIWVRGRKSVYETLTAESILRYMP